MHANPGHPETSHLHGDPAGLGEHCVFVLLTHDVLVDGAIIDIGASTFPGTYYAVGDTFARSRTTGKDEEFQLIIPKAKVMSENTITMEAEGDPSVFNMNLRVLRPADGKMVRLVKYKLSGTGSDPAADTTSIYHATDLKANAAKSGQK